MIRLPLLATLTLLAASPSLPQTATHSPTALAHSFAAIERIHWTYDDENVRDGSEWQLRFRHDRSNSSIDADGDPAVQRIVDAIGHAAPGEALSFELARDAGRLSCTGHAEEGGRGSGTCRFDPDNGFAAELARRDIALDDADDMLALALVDAHLETVDALTKDGFRFDDSGDLIAVSALGVTSGFAEDLRGAGLKIDELGDLIAAKALKIDSRWLGEMADAGYPNLEVGRAIQMRALGVTPDYAVKMARVLRAVGEIE